MAPQKGPHAPNVPLSQVSYNLECPSHARQPSPPQGGIRCLPRRPTLHVGLGSLEDMILDLGVKAAGVAWGRGAKLVSSY